MHDTTPPPPPVMQSTPGTLVTTGPDGQQTTHPVQVVHAPGVTPPDTITHDTSHCWCAP